MVEKVARNVSELLDVIRDLKDQETQAGNNADLIFRGQSSSAEPVPKISRLEARGQRTHVEKLMLEEFKRNSSNELALLPTSDWDWLALAQHHGLPTRLLDWTFSSIVALWFAVNDDLGGSIDGTQFYGHATVFILAPTIDLWTLKETTVDPFQITSEVIFRPKALSKRIIVQSSVFTAHPVSDGQSVAEFWGHGSLATHFTKVYIPNEFVVPIRRELRTMGVNRYILFPDLDGLCRHLQWQFFHTEDERAILDPSVPKP